MTSQRAFGRMGLIKSSAQKFETPILTSPNKKMPKARPQAFQQEDHERAGRDRA